MFHHFLWTFSMEKSHEILRIFRLRGTQGTKAQD
jgi:hypothetical protein